MKNIGKLLLALSLLLPMTAQAQHIGWLLFGTQPAAQAWVTGPATLVNPTTSTTQVYAGGVNEWLYTYDAGWKIFKDWATSMGMGHLVTWAIPNQKMIPDPNNPPFGEMVDPQNTQWRIGIEPRVWGALTAEQQYQVMNPTAQNNLLNQNYGSIMSDSNTGIRSY